MDTLSLSKGPLTPARILTHSTLPFMGQRGTYLLFSSSMKVASSHHYANKSHCSNRKTDIAVLMRQPEETAAHLPGRTEKRIYRWIGYQWMSYWSCRLSDHMSEACALGMGRFLNLHGASAKKVNDAIHRLKSVHRIRVGICMAMLHF